MKPFFSLLLLLASVVSASAVTIDTVPVGDVGNPDNPADGDKNIPGVQTFGGVGYAYSIGKYEVTVGQYVAFLNAVATTDTYGLYNTEMQTELNSAGIQRQGVAGAYSYTVLGSPNHPISYVSWGDAARFTNWLHNGQPSGAQGPGTTEQGAYSLNGAVSIGDLMLITRNASAIWFIPTENEWYKAAYYQPAAQGGDSDGYWAYPMKTNNEPYSDQPPGATPDNTRVANFNKNDSTANGYNDGYAVTGSTSYSSSQNYLTDGGAYASSPSYYGTFDQGGNVREWNEAAVSSLARGSRGGAWAGLANDLLASVRGDNDPTIESRSAGFRVATLAVPVPGDFNNDGVVDARDYITLRKGNHPLNDYTDWRAAFGNPSGSGASLETAVPEPSSLALLLLALVLGAIVYAVR
jgi:formylglycine-generating enzyme required for sulfatase activity